MNYSATRYNLNYRPYCLASHSHHAMIWKDHRRILPLLFIQQRLCIQILSSTSPLLPMSTLMSIMSTIHYFIYINLLGCPLLLFNSFQYQRRRCGSAASTGRAMAEVEWCLRGAVLRAGAEEEQVLRSRC